jgi:hypothetical protein
LDDDEDEDADHQQGGDHHQQSVGQISQHLLSSSPAAGEPARDPRPYCWVSFKASRSHQNVSMP